MIPESLRTHILHKLKISLERWKGWSASQAHHSAERFCDLLRTSEQGQAPRTFMESGLKLSRALVALDSKEWTFERVSMSSVSEILATYENYIEENNRVFENITNHHNNIVDEDWSQVASNDASLAVYSQAANAMGSKVWVVECNKWFETFSISYFRKGGARKHFIKTQCARYKAMSQADSDQGFRGHLERDLMQPTDGERQRKIRLVDVGSCYNPIAKSEQANEFEVTALDLYPVDPSVLQCDFLNLSMGETGSEPVMMHTDQPSPPVNPPAISVECDTNPTLKRQRIEPMDNMNSVDNAITRKCMPTELVENVLSSTSTKLVTLPAHSYDVVTMCLVVSYLPTPEQRLKMIQQARALLVSPLTEADAEGSSSEYGFRQPPHRNGLLLIAEKQSIFKPPFKMNNKKANNKTHNNNVNVSAHKVVNAERKDELANFDYWSSWVSAVCSCGFELVKYHYFPTTDGRKSHLFAFATVPLKETVDSSTADFGNKMWIKQDHLREVDNKLNEN